MASLPWPRPDVLPPNVERGSAVAKTAWVLFTISTVLILGRVYSKLFKLKRLAVDDALMVFAWATALIYSIAIQKAFHDGLGRHWEYLTIPSSLAILKWIYVAQAFCIICPVFGRVSFCFYLLAIIGKVKHELKYPLYAFALLQIVTNFALVVTLYSICGTDFVIIGNPATTCYKPSPWANFTFFVGSINVLTDAFLTLAPSLMVWKFRTHLRVKVAACILLSLSIVAMGAAIWRTVEVHVLFQSDIDFAYDINPYFHASSVELNVVIIAASIPTLGPIFKRKRGKGSSSGSSGRFLSGDTDEIQYNVGQALGMRMPKLGNSVVITGGPLARGPSDEETLPLSPMKPAAIKRTMHTDVSVQYTGGISEEMIETFPPVRTTVKF